MLPGPEPPDHYDRTVRVDAWVNGREAEVIAVCHPEQITILAPDTRIEVRGDRWRAFAMRIAIRMFLAGKKLTRR